MVQASILKEIEVSAGTCDFTYNQNPEEKGNYYDYLFDKSNTVIKPSFLTRQSLFYKLSFRRLHVMNQWFFLGGKPSYYAFGLQLDLLQFRWLQIGVGTHVGKVALNEFLNLNKSAPFKEMYNLGVGSAKEAITPYLTYKSFHLKDNFYDACAIVAGASKGVFSYVRSIPDKIRRFRAKRRKRKGVSLTAGFKEKYLKEVRRSSGIKELVKNQFIMHAVEDHRSAYLLYSEIYCRCQCKLFSASISRGVDFFLSKDMIFNQESDGLYLLANFIPCLLSAKAVIIEINFLPFISLA